MNDAAHDDTKRQSSWYQSLRIPLMALVAVNTCVLISAPITKNRSDAAQGDDHAARQDQEVSPTPTGTGASQEAAPEPKSRAAPPTDAEPADKTYPSPAEFERFFSSVAENASSAAPGPNHALPEPSLPDASGSRADDEGKLLQTLLAAARDADSQSASAAEPQEDVLDLPPAGELQDSASEEPGRLVLWNPSDTGAPVGYLANGEEFWLRPGERHELPSQESHAIAFHRGGEFGEARFVLDDGVYRFRVTSAGWDLATGDDAAR